MGSFDPGFIAKERRSFEEKLRISIKRLVEKGWTDEAIDLIDRLETLMMQKMAAYLK